MNPRNCLPAALVALSFFVLPGVVLGEGEIGFVEKFALAPDREKVLGELVPGSEDYYYFHALHFQHARNEARLAEILDQWRKRFPDESPRRRVIENREALLDYEKTPQQTLEYLKDRLNVQLNHEQVARDAKPNLPTALDPKLIARSVFEDDVLKNDDELSSITASAAEAMVAQKRPLTMAQRRALLGLLERPDVPGLVEFIVAELRDEESGGFGSFSIHEQLLPAQLDALAKAIPALASEEEFVKTRLRKLAPSEDVDITIDAAEREAWLIRVWAYVQTLPPAFNTIKARVLYLRLDHDWKKGVYDQARFLEYLKIPRPMDYVHPRWMEAQERFPAADLDADLSDALAGREPVHNDEALVRQYFLALFERAAVANPRALGEAMMKPYLAYVRDTWLKPILAEALIVGGHGPAERWAGLLTPAAFQALKERVDIDFPKTNPELFAPGADVAFDVTLKNTPQLIVKIYELNALNIFRDQQKQLNTDLALDGLVANTEQSHTFDIGPFKRNRQTFRFPELKGRRGAWMIEFIGGGRSSRALIRVGQWQIVQQLSPAGDMLRVLDEAGAPMDDAVAWLDGRKYTRDAKLGGIVIPFTEDEEKRPVIIGTADGSFATLTEFQHHEESYQLDAQFHLEREQLLAGRTATLAVRAALRLGDAELDLSVLREARLTITAQTRGGISTTQEFDNLKFSAGAVLTQAIAVPERLDSIEATLTGKIEILSEGGEKEELTASAEWTINEIDGTAHTNDGHLAKFEGNYVYELLGKNGEALPEQPVAFSIFHRGFERPQTLSLKTDAKGRIHLGPLVEIEKLSATPPNEREGVWELKDFDRTWSDVVHTSAGNPVRIPAPPKIASAPEALAKAISLLQVNGETCVADLVAKVKLQGGFLVIDGLAPGDYSLHFRGTEQEIEIKVSGGKPAAGWYLGSARNLEAKAETPLHITSIASDAEAVTVKLAHVTPFTRVHIAATRFDPGSGIFGSLAHFSRFGADSGTPARRPNLYSAGRSIGDEYRYILERRHAKTFPGNMLTRPGLLLNPWELRATDVEVPHQQGGEKPADTAGNKEAETEDGTMKSVIESDSDEAEATTAGTNLDFLASVAPVLYNLKPDQDGVVKIDRRAFGDRQHVQVYAEDLANAVWQTIALPEAATKLVDRRLQRNLDPAKPFTQKKDVTVLTAGKSLSLADLQTGELQTFDTIARVYALFRSLNPDRKLAEFAWLLDWPKLNESEKRAKYSEHACHELHLFLWRKDAAFFDQVIRPFLANKKDKTFVDDFLVGADLAKYLEPSDYARLNAAERALLALRIKDAAPDAARELREQWDLVPPNPDLQHQLFETALSGRALQEGGTSQLAPGVFALTGLTDPSFQVVVRAIDETRAKDRRRAGMAQAAGGVAGAPAEHTQGVEKAKTPADGMSDIRPQSERKETATRFGLEVARGAENAPSGPASAPDSPALPSLANGIRPGGSPITAGNRSGNLAISANAIDALLFGGEATTLARETYRPLYRVAGETKEWAENNYYKLRITEQNAALIPVNAFWRDYADWVAAGGNGAFLSPHLAEAHRNFSEIMFALAVLDLPFEAPKHDRKTEGGQFTLNARGPVIAFHKQIGPAAAQNAAAAGAPRLLVSQSFFREGDRYRTEGNEQFEKYVTKEFLTGVVYGANVVVTNPTSAPLAAEVLLQVPQGALPVLGSKETDSRRARLEPYTTQTFLYHFYFPSTPADGGVFRHYPVNVRAIGRAPEQGGTVPAEPFSFHVVEKLTEVDKTSWDYVSQYGSDADVFTYLEQNNLSSLDLDRIAWRCRDAAFFTKLVAFLRAHHTWNETIYSYALMHNNAAALAEWIQHKEEFVAECGPWFASKLVVLDAIARRTYEHLEYAPLVNQRAHRLGTEWRIANPELRQQYQSFLEVLAHKPRLDAADDLAFVTTCSCRTASQKDSAGFESSISPRSRRSSSTITFVATRSFMKGTSPKRAGLRRGMRRTRFPAGACSLAT